jgi:hypothetical protein
MILNGIEPLADRADLADRMIVVDLPVIQELRRRSEAAVWRDYHNLWPTILGGLCDAAAAALRNQSQVVLPALPRMADFAIWATAAEPLLGCRSGGFMRAYSGNRQAIVESTIDGDVVARAVRDLMNQQAEWTGTATDLLSLLDSRVDDRTKRAHSWPGNPRSMTGRLKRAATFLRSAGIDIIRSPRGRLLTIRQTGDFCVTTVPTALRPAASVSAS